MFNKLVIIEKINIPDTHIDKLNEIAKKVIYYKDLPNSDEEIITRIDDADAVLLSYTSYINKNILEKCKNIKYIGMCCSLYSPKSANVDIKTANELGIVVKGSVTV